MSHTSPALVCLCVSEGEFLLTWMCQHALLACVCVCVCLCASSWIREAHGNTYCIAVATDPSPFLKMHTHSHTHTHTYFFCDQWRAHMCPVYWMRVNIHSLQQKKNMKGSVSALPWATHTHTQIPATGTCIVCHLGTQQWKVLALQGFFIYLCEFMHVKLCVRTPEYMHISNFTLTGSVLYLTFTLKS